MNNNTADSCTEGSKVSTTAGTWLKLIFCIVEQNYNFLPDLCLFLGHMKLQIYSVKIARVTHLQQQN
jgi:hypothetical protein